MDHPEGAITDHEALKVIIVLGLPVEVWDVDMNTIRERFPTAITPGHRGEIIQFKDGMGQYSKWYGFNDPTYNATEVLWSSPDEIINRAEALQPSIYMFNTRDEAVRAQQKRAQEMRLKRKFAS